MFSIADRVYRWQEVLDAGRHWGDLAGLKRQAADGIAAVDRVAMIGPPIEEAEVHAAEDDFRHAHKLLAAEDMIAWLARWELVYDDWLEYGRRGLARARLDGRIQESITSSRPDPDRVANVLWAETVCSGSLAEWAWRLAGQVASADALGVSPRGGLAEVEQASEARAEQSLTQRAAAKALEGRRSDWVQVECTVLELPSEGMAREAALCVADEGMSLPEIAVRAGVSVADRTLSLEEAAPELAQPLLGATAGDIVGPVAVGDRFVFAAVHHKRAPTLDDPEVRTRVYQEVRRRTTDSDVGARIRWHDRP